MKFIFVSLFLFISLNLRAQTSYVAPTKILLKKGYQIGVSGEYWKSSTRIDKDGKDQGFEDGEGFSRIQGEVSGHYGLTENLQIGGGARFRQNAYYIHDQNADEDVTETATGIESTFVNLIFAFKPVDRLQYVLDGTFRFKTYSNEESSVSGTNNTTGSLVLGDQGNEYSIGMGVTYSSLRNNFFTARGGYRNPGTDISTELYWQLEGVLAWKYVALVAGVDGITSLKNDPYENKETERPAYNTGATFLYNGSNRQMIAPYAGVNFALGNTWRVEFKGSQVVQGTSTDLGTSFGASLIRRVEDKGIQKADKKFKQYDFEGTVTKVSPKKGYLIIDKGVAEDVLKGMKIDFYEFDYVGGNILLASGVVIQAKADTSIVKITHFYNTKKELKEGTIARGSFR